MLLREGLTTGLALRGIGQHPQKSIALALGLAPHWETIALSLIPKKLLPFPTEPWDGSRASEM